MVGNCDREWYLLANSFKKLRVLDLNKINFPSVMPPDITDLIFLRYLALSSSKLLNHIPMWKNWNLQTLIINEDDNGAHKLPHGIWDLPQLRHLEIYHQVFIDLPKVAQENLQTLYWLSTLECTMEVFLRISNVKDLGIIAGRAKIFPPNLKELIFVRTLIPWEAMSVISLLPNLEVLKLRNFACVGQEWELIEEGGFQQLKFLLISLTNLKEWKADVDCPFPKLEHLLLRNCFELKEMPEWIDNINALKLIKLEYCYASLVSSAQRIKEEKLENLGKDVLDVLDSGTRLDENHAKEEEDSDEQTCEDHGLTSMWFEARKLRIAWGDDPRYWIWTIDSESGLNGDAFGMSTQLALASVSYENDKSLYGWMHGDNRHSQVFLAKRKSYGDRGQFPTTILMGGWRSSSEIFTSVSSGKEGEIGLQLWHTSDQYWKSGFVVKGIEVRLTS